jgi:hypothetical protein
MTTPLRWLARLWEAVIERNWREKASPSEVGIW